MAKGVSLTIKGLPELKKKFGQIPQTVIDDVDALMGVVANDFVNRAVDAAPVDQGLLKNEITARHLGPLKWEVVSGAFYSPYIEWGTRSRVKVNPEQAAYAAQFKGLKTGGTAEQFLESIKRWVRVKGIRFDSAATVKSGKNKGKNKQLTVEQTAYIIFHYIMLKGIHPHPFFFPQLPIAREEINKNIQPVVAKALSK